jgi:nitrate reductase gamma subunit
LDFPYISLAIGSWWQYTARFTARFRFEPVDPIMERKKLCRVRSRSIRHHSCPAGYLLALLLPKSLQLWNAVPIRLYLLELTGLGLGIWALAGLCILLWRRLSDKRIWSVTTPMDLVVLVLLLVSAVTGVLVAGLYRFGSTWFTVIFTPYLLSVITFQPQVSLVAPLPWLIKAACG